MQHDRTIRNLVVKLGSAVLTAPGGGLDTALLADLARQVTQLEIAGVTVTLVSSGAVAAGVAELRLGGRPADLARLQAVAAVGQRRLMDAWAAAFAPRPVAQLLVTRDDVDDRVRFLNLRDTLRAAHELGALAILNENDTIATDEIDPAGREGAAGSVSFGDNDMLAAVISAALHADALILLSTAPGLQAADGNVVERVTDLATARQLVRSDLSATGRGGMAGKLDAAGIVTAAGEPMVIADGRLPDVLPRLLAGEAVGTWFEPTAGRRSGRRRWLTAARPCGDIVIDAGAVRAVRGGNASLLPAGVTGQHGRFTRGDVVRVLSLDGEPIAQGLTRYGSDDLPRVAGLKSMQLARLDPPGAYDEVIHRDDLVLIGK